MHISRTALAGLSLAAIAAITAACGSASSSSTGSQGSGTVATAPATTKPAAPPTTSVSIKDIVAGRGNACDVVPASQIEAAIGPITRTRNVESKADCEWVSAQSVATLAFQTPNYWPTALTDTYSNPLSPSPCPDDPNGVYGTSSSQYVTGAFCSTRDYEVQVLIAPVSNNGDNGPTQIKAVGTITAGILAHNS